MSTLELKGGLYDLISRIDDPDLLRKMFKLIDQLINDQGHIAGLEASMATKDQIALKEAIEESYDENNLIDHATAMEEIKGWVNPKE